MVVKRAVPISTLELQSRVEHADAMATRRSRSSLRDDNRMVVASRRRGGHGGDGRRFAATRWSQLYFRRLTPNFFAMFSHEHGRPTIFTGFR